MTERGASEARARRAIVAGALAVLAIAALVSFGPCGAPRTTTSPLPTTDSVAEPAAATGATPATRAARAQAPQDPTSDAHVGDAATTGAISGFAFRLDGVPAAGARVRAAPGGDEAKRVVATAAPDGSFRFDGLAPGRWTVACAGGGYGTRLDMGAEPAIAGVVAGSEVRVVVRGQALAVVAGNVTDPDGKPVAKASVRLRCGAFLSPDGGVWDLEATTEEDGSYEVKNVSPGGFASLHLAADGFAQTQRRLPDVAPGARLTEDVALERAVVLEVVLLAEDDGAPVVDAIVWVHDAESRSPYEGPHGDAYKSDGDGRVRVAGLKPRPVTLQIDAPGFARPPDPRVDPSAQRGPLVLRLARGKAITGRVVGPAGAPVAGERVTAAPAEPARHEDPFPAFVHSVASTESGADGTFALHGLAPGTYVVGIWTDTGTEIAVATADAGASDVVLRVPDRARGPRKITVRVVAPDGARVPKARIRSGRSFGGAASSYGGGMSQDAEVEVTLEEDGDSFVEVWDARDASGARLPLGHVLALVPRDAPETWILRLAPERAVEGVVLGPDDKPVEGATIAVETVPGGEFDRSMSQELVGTTSGAAGRFKVGGLGDEPVRITASADGHYGTPVVAAAGNADAVLRLVPDARCELQVVDHENRPVERASVFARTIDDTNSAHEHRFLPFEALQTDARGRVRLRGLAPGRKASLRIWPDASADLLGVLRNDWTPEEVVIRLERGWTLEGVVRVGGSSAAEGSVEAWRDGACAGSSEIAKDGSFRIRRVPAGRYELRASAGPGRNLHGSVVAETGGPAVTIEATARDPR